MCSNFFFSIFFILKGNVDDYLEVTNTMMAMKTENRLSWINPGYNLDRLD